MRKNIQIKIILLFSIIGILIISALGVLFINTMNNIIALNLGDEVLFLNVNGKIVKRYELENQLSDVKLYNKGTLAALVFRDRIELVKL